jgi:hypothetical protein
VVPATGGRAVGVRSAARSRRRPLEPARGRAGGDHASLPPRHVGGRDHDHGRIGAGAGPRLPVARPGRGRSRHRLPLPPAAGAHRGRSTDACGCDVRSPRTPRTASPTRTSSTTTARWWPRAAPSVCGSRRRSSLTITDDPAVAEFDVDEGATLTFALAYAPLHGGDQLTDLDPDEALAGRIEGWRSWVGCTIPSRGRAPTRCSAARWVLQGLAYQQSGAVLAAATTSLPAALGGSDNWNYRYAWLRDLSLMTQALWIGRARTRPGGSGVPSPTQPAGRATVTGCRSCTASTDDDSSRSVRSITSAATPTAGPSGQATPRVGPVTARRHGRGARHGAALPRRPDADGGPDRRLLRWMADEAAATWTSDDAGM